MTRLLLHAATGASAALAAFAALSLGGASPQAQAGPFPLVASLGAAFALGFLISATAPREADARRSAAIRFLAAFNPALVAAALLGSSALLAAAASLLVWRGVFALAAYNDHRATILLAIALAAAPLLSPSALAFYPALLVLAPLLSPWGLAPRRAAGFLAALIAPLALLAAGGVFLLWLAGGSFDAWMLARPAPHAPFEARSLFALLAAPGLLLVAAGFAATGRAWKAALIFFVAAAGMIALTGSGAIAAASALTAGHIAWAAQSNRALGLLAAGFLASGALVLAELSPAFRLAAAGLVEQGFARIAPAPPSP